MSGKIVTEMNEMREMAGLGPLDEAVSPEAHKVAMAFLKKNHKVISGLAHGMSKEVRKETGDGIGFAAFGELLREFITG